MWWYVGSKFAESASATCAKGILMGPKKRAKSGGGKAGKDGAKVGQSLVKDRNRSTRTSGAASWVSACGFYSVYFLQVGGALEEGYIATSINILFTILRVHRIILLRLDKFILTSAQRNIQLHTFCPDRCHHIATSPCVRIDNFM